MADEGVEVDFIADFTVVDFGVVLEGFTSDFGVEPLEDFRDFLTGLGSFESGSDSSSSSPASMIAGDADGSRSSSSSSSAAPP